MKNLDMVCKPLFAICRDAESWDNSPQLAHDIKLSMHTIKNRVSTRGIRELMIGLPKVGKWLDKSLSTSVLDLGIGPAEFRMSEQHLLFSTLFQRIFDMSVDGPIKPILYNPCVNSIFFLRQIFFCYKKVKLPCSDANINKEVTKYFDIEKELRAPDLPWSSSPILFKGALDNFRPTFSQSFSSMATGNGTDVSMSYTTDTLFKLLDSVSGIVGSQFPRLNPKDLLPRHGPGAVSDAGGRADKYDFPSWSNNLEELFPSQRFAFPNRRLALEHGVEFSNELPLANLLAVPKTLEKPRLITCEPTAQQYIQQGLLLWIRENLPYPIRLCYDFASQNPSRDGAVQAALDLKSATVDLSAASDRLSAWSVERFLATSGLLPYLQACRTPYVSCERYGHSIPSFELRKFAGQGSGVTFPVQSICYSIAAITAVLYAWRLKPSKRNIQAASRKIQVFGDDIIIPKEGLPYLSLIFQLCQLKINGDKTHHLGGFRESCGMDSWRGHNVTPVYLTHLDSIGKDPRKITSLVDVSNNAYKAGLWNLAHTVSKTIPSRFRRDIPVHHRPLRVLTFRTFIPSEQPHGTMIRRDYDTQGGSARGLGLVAKNMEAESEGGYQELMRFFRATCRQKDDRPWTDDPWSAGFMISSHFNLKRQWAPFLIG